MSAMTVEFPGGVVVEAKWKGHSDAAKRVTLVRIALQLPDSFPEKYRAAIERAVDQCAVKKHIVEPPRFELTVS